MTMQTFRSCILLLKLIRGFAGKFGRVRDRALSALPSFAFPFAVPLAGFIVLLSEKRKKYS